MEIKNGGEIVSSSQWDFQPGESALFTQNLCQRKLIIHEVYVLDLNWTISAWRRGKASSAILAKPLSDCVTFLCLGQCMSRHLRVCGILKRTYYSQRNWISYILNWDVRCLCCRWLWFHVLLFWASSSNCPTFNWRTSLTTCIEVGIHQRK